MDLLGTGTARPDEPFWMKKVKHLHPIRTQQTTKFSEMSRWAVLRTICVLILRPTKFQDYGAVVMVFMMILLMCCCPWPDVMTCSLAIDDQNRCGGVNSSSSTYVPVRTWSHNKLILAKQCFSCRRSFSKRACLFTSITRLTSTYKWIPCRTYLVSNPSLHPAESWSAMQKRLPPYWRPPRSMVWQLLVRLHKTPTP